MSATAPWFRQQYFDPDGKPLSGGHLCFYSAGSVAYKNIWLDLVSTNPAPNPMPLDSSGVVSKQYFLDSGLYDIAIYDANNELVDTIYNVQSVAGGSVYPTPASSGYLYYDSGTGTYSWVAINALDDHKVMTTNTDATPSYLNNKVVASDGITINTNIGAYGAMLQIRSKGQVSVDGTDSLGYLFDKIGASAGITKTNINGQCLLNADLGYIANNINIYQLMANYKGPSHQILWYGVDQANSEYGPVVSASALSFGDPTRLGALYAPSIQSEGSIIVGARDGFWDSQWFSMFYNSIGGTVQLTPGYSNTKYIYAHNNSNNASVVTDKASFGNLANNGLVFAAMMPNTSDDLIYLNTATGLSYNPTSTILTAPKLAIGNLTSAGVLVNDASGNVSSVPAGTFTDDHMLLVSSQDTTPSYLGTKLAAGNNIGFQVTSDSHGQKLWISARSNMLLNPTYVTTNYTVIDTDVLVCNNSNNAITVTLPTPGTTYNGRGVYVYNMGTSSVTINTVSGGIVGYTPSISGYGKMLFRCLKGADGNYYWMAGA